MLFRAWENSSSVDATINIFWDMKFHPIFTENKRYFRALLYHKGKNVHRQRLVTKASSRQFVLNLNHAQ